MKTFTLALCLMLSGCAYNAHNDPYIEWPALWMVDDHAEKAERRAVIERKSLKVTTDE